MRVALLVTVLLLAGCGGHKTATSPPCRLSFAAIPVPETGEHSLAVRSSCALPPHPKVALDGIPFTYLFEGGPRGAHTILFDKYRCDIRAQKIAREVTVARRRLHMQTSLIDWCPAEAVSTVVHVYLGALRRAPAGWRDVLRRPDRVWPCGALRTAVAHLPSSFPTYTTLPERLERATAAACEAQIAGIRTGAPRRAVTEAFGDPDLAGPRCPVWRWKPFDAVDGVRVCFRSGRAMLVQRAVHG